MPRDRRPNSRSESFLPTSKNISAQGSVLSALITYMRDRSRKDASHVSKAWRFPPFNKLRDVRETKVIVTSRINEPTPHPTSFTSSNVSDEYSLCRAFPSYAGHLDCHNTKPLKPSQRAIITSPSMSGPGAKSALSMNVFIFQAHEISAVEMSINVTGLNLTARPT